MRFANPYQAANPPSAVKAIHRNIAMKMTMSTGSTMTPRIHRKVLRAPSKLHPGKLHPGKLHAGKRQPNKSLSNKITHMHQHQLQHSGKLISSRGKMLARSPSLPRPIETCDNSNDSGLGFDHPMEIHVSHRNNPLRFSEQSDISWQEENQQTKNPKPDLKFDSDNANDNFNFPEMTRPSKQLSPSSTTYRATLGGGKMSSSLASKRRALSQALPIGPVNLCSQLLPHSRDGRVQLQIVSQPEQQHRARYQTEGSRGAVKDRTGNSFPIVKLIGYDQPTTLQVFIGTDIGRVAPHMFYQACRVFGKNSTPCSEKKEDGTVLIEIELNSQKNWQVTCDCVGILKERNVDVEHRFGDQTGQRCKKKSTRCRMVFRAQLQNADGTVETIQVCSQPIVCTQPPGVPEICRKSLNSCPANGGLELFLIGKNFLKDSKVVFQSDNNLQGFWEETVLPDKEFLQQNHLVCGVPPFCQKNINESVSVRLYVVSGGKASESLKFVYTPNNQNSEPPHASLHHSAQGVNNGYFINGDVKEEVKPVLMWEANSTTGMMPPPAAPLRRPSIILPDQNTSPLSDFKSELADDSSQGSLVDSENGDIGSSHIRNSRFKVHNEASMDINDNSVDGFHVRVRQLPLESIPHDSNICVLSDNSNTSTIVNDNSVDMIGLNQNSSAVCRMNENNMNMLIGHNENSKLSTINENGVGTYSHPSALSSQMIENQIIVGSVENQAQVLSNNTSIGCDILNNPRRMSPDELKVMDLRMKPGAIGSDSDPSLATIRQFVNSHSKLPTQTGQSVETYLSNIDNKSLLQQNININKAANSLVTFSQQMQTIQNQNTTDRVMESVAAVIFNTPNEPNGNAAIYPSQTTMQQIVIPPVTPIDQLIVTKQLHDTILPYNNIISATLDNSQVKTDMYNSNCARVELPEKMSTNSQISHHQAMLNNQSVQIEALVSSAFHASIMTSPTAPSELDTIINSSVESHLSSPHSDSSSRHSPSSHDVILSSHSSPDIVMNTAPQISPVSQEMIHPHSTNVLSPEIILNPQVFPTMMCTTDGTLLGTQPLTSSISQQLLPNGHNLTSNSQESLTIMTSNQPIQNEGIPLLQSPHIISPTVKTPPSAFKNMILNAAAEIFTSDKAINALVSTAIQTANILTNENAQNQSPLICTQAPSVPVVELQQPDQPAMLPGNGGQFPSNIPYAPQIQTEQYASQGIVENAVNNLTSQMKEDNISETSVMSQAVTEAVSQAVSQVVSQAVNQTVNQEMKNSGTMQSSMSDNEILTSMSDNELLNYINPSCFDQV